MARALAQAQALPTLLLPAYRGVAQRLQSLCPVADLPGLPGGDARLLSGICPQSGLPFLLLDNDALYDRDGLYLDSGGQPYPDNALRYAALAHASVRIAQGLPGLPRPDLVHAHDWHAALAPLLLRAAGIEDVKSVLTIHNLAFQGQAPLEDAAALGIGPAFRGEDGAMAWGQLNFMKAGIRYADRVTTVSQRYAREILTPAFGCGLDGVLRERETDLLAIANGIDTQLWNPTRDPHLGPLRYSAADLANKRLCKAAVQHEYGLREDPQAVLMIMCSRLTGQKMADVAAQALPQALEAHPSLQVAVLGQGERHLEAALAELAGRFPRRCAVRIGYDEAGAHRLHAAGDVLLHGSRFEPFGLTPLYAMRYGTLPIGSRVGGMADTIADPGPHQPLTAMARATGVLFDGDAPADMAAAIARALHLHGHATLWRAMQRNAMTADFSWRPAVAQYLALFQALGGDRAAPAESPLAESATPRARQARRAASSPPPCSSRNRQWPCLPPRRASITRRPACRPTTPRASGCWPGSAATDSARCWSPCPGSARPTRARWRRSTPIARRPRTAAPGRCRRAWRGMPARPPSTGWHCCCGWNCSAWPAMRWTVRRPPPGITIRSTTRRAIPGCRWPNTASGSCARIRRRALSMPGPRACCAGRARGSAATSCSRRRISMRRHGGRCSRPRVRPTPRCAAWPGRRAWRQRPWPACATRALTACFHRCRGGTTARPGWPRSWNACARWRRSLPQPAHWTRPARARPSPATRDAPGAPR